MSKQEKTYWRDLTFNIFHREWPGLYNTDADNVEYIYKNGTPEAVAVVDHKHESAKWCERSNPELVNITQSSIKGLYNIASRAGLPLYVGLHNADFSIWTIYLVISYDHAKVHKNRIPLRDFVDWLYELHGQKAEEMIERSNALSRSEKDQLLKKYRNLKRIDQTTRDEYITRGIETAFSQLSNERSKLLLAQRLLNAAINLTVKVIPILDDKEKSA